MNLIMDTQDYPISFIVDLYNNENEIFSPDYQRKQLLWRSQAKIKIYRIIATLD